MPQALWSCSLGHAFKGVLGKVLTFDDLLRLWSPVIIANTGQRLDTGASFALDAACHHLKAHHLNAPSLVTSHEADMQCMGPHC